MRDTRRAGSGAHAVGRASALGGLRRALAREPIETPWPLLPALAALVGCWLVMAMPWLAFRVTFSLVWLFDLVPLPWPSLGERVTIPWDAKAHFLPQVQFLAQSLARGDWPWWTPYVFSGHPQIADPQAMIFSPPFLLLALVNGDPGLLAVDVTVLAMGLAGGIALLAWMRDQGWHWAGALVGGVVFCFGASMAWRMQHIGQVLSLAYWPMAMFTLDRAIRLGSYRWGVASGLIAAAIVLGRDQVALLVAYLLVAQVLWRWATAEDRRATLRSSIGPLVAGGVLAVALVAVPLFLTMMLAAESNRPVIDYEGAGRGSLHPALLLTFLLPQVFGAAYDMADYWGPPSMAWNDTGLYIAQNMGQLYLGAAPVLLLLVAAFRGGFLARDVRFFSAAFVVVTLYALGWYTPLFRVAYEVLPGVKFYRRPADATFLMGGLAALLVGYATHRLFTNPWRRDNENAVAATGAVVVSAFMAALGIALWLDKVGTLPKPLTVAVLSLAAGLAALLYARPRIALEPAAAAAVLAAVTTLDLAYNNGPSTSSALPVQHYAAMAPATRDATVQALQSRLAEARAADRVGDRRDRMEFMGVGFHWPNVSLSHRLENTLGYNPVRLRLYSQATGADDHIGLPDQRKFSPLFPSYRSLLADMLGLRFIAAGEPLEWRDKALRTGDLRLLAKTDSAWIYENPRALPRVTMVAGAARADFARLIATGAWPAGFDPKRTVLLDTGFGDGVGRMNYADLGAGAGPSTSARLVSYRNTEIVVAAESRQGGWLVLNDPWHPWWFAEVDGKPTPLLRANVLFRAVELPAGTHTVRFVFRPITGALAAWRAGSR